MNIAHSKLGFFRLKSDNSWDSEEILMTCDINFVMVLAQNPRQPTGSDQYHPNFSQYIHMPMCIYRNVCWCLCIWIESAIVFLTIFSLWCFSRFQMSLPLKKFLFVNLMRMFWQSLEMHQTLHGKSKQQQMCLRRNGRHKTSGSPLPKTSLGICSAS